jgi:hypothetical protein
MTLIFALSLQATFGPDGKSSIAEPNARQTVHRTNSATVLSNGENAGMRKIAAHSIRPPPSGNLDRWEPIKKKPQVVSSNTPRPHQYELVFGSSAIQIRTEAGPFEKIPGSSSWDSAQEGSLDTTPWALWICLGPLLLLNAIVGKADMSQKACHEKVDAKRNLQKFLIRERHALSSSNVDCKQIHQKQSRVPKKQRARQQGFCRAPQSLLRPQY